MAKPWEKYQKPWEKYQSPEPVSWVSDVGSALHRGTVELFERLAGEGMGSTLFAATASEPVAKAIEHNDPITYSWLTGGHAQSDSMPAPQTLPGKIAEFVPTVAASIPGWEVGAEEFAGLLGERAVPWLAKQAVKGVGGTLGSDLTTGETPTLGNVGAGTAANVVAESLFHIPAALVGTVQRQARVDAELLAAADQVGIAPTLGMITGKSAYASAEAALSKLPGAGLINTARAQAVERAGSFWEGLKQAAGYAGDSNSLGMQLQDAVRKYLENFKAEASDMYDAATAKVGARTKMNTYNYSNLLHSISERYSRSSMRSTLDSPFVTKMAADAKAAAGGATHTGYKNILLEVGEARALLARIGEAMVKPDNAFKGIQDSDLARLASALRDDISDAFHANGSGAEWDAANAHYAAGRAIYEQAERAVAAKHTADNVYTALFGNVGNGFRPMGLDTIKAVKATVSPEMWQKVRAEVIHRMGEAPNGVATVGKDFNPAVFLSNFNKMTSQQLEAIFDAEQLGDLNVLARVSAMMKRTGLEANHSNTAHHLAQLGIAGSAAKELMNLRPLRALVTLVGAPAAAKLTSLVFVNPQVARSVAEIAAATEQTQAQRGIVKLMAILAANPDVMNELEQELESEQN